MRAMDAKPFFPTTAVLLIAHGSRQADANADLVHVAEELLRLGRYAIIEVAFLELAEPDIDAGAAKCVERGARQVILLPYFLSAGVHVRRDLNQAQRRLTERFPQAAFTLAEPLGRHPLLVQVVAERALAAE